MFNKGDRVVWTESYSSGPDVFYLIGTIVQVEVEDNPWMYVKDLSGGIHMILAEHVTRLSPINSKVAWDDCVWRP